MLNTQLFIKKILFGIFVFVFRGRIPVQNIISFRVIKGQSIG